MDHLSRLSQVLLLELVLLLIIVKIMVVSHAVSRLRLLRLPTHIAVNVNVLTAAIDCIELVKHACVLALSRTGLLVAIAGAALRVCALFLLNDELLT